MAEKIIVITLPLEKSIKITKWKVKEGNAISIGRVILLYDVVSDNKSDIKKLKASQAGTVHRIVAQEGDVVHSGEILFELKECSHPTVMKDMCAECGADLRKEDIRTLASVPMVHSVPELKVSEELAQKLGQADSDRLLRDRKLVLLVDLDQTLIHTTNDNIPANIKDVYHFQLYGSKSPWYHTRLRPGTHNFLKNMTTLFELHICTFGARNYAHMIAMFLDQDGKYFSHRILSRDECFDPTSKTANLKALFPCGDNMVCIIDDREDVWSYASNLIHVKPYHFFQHTGDINAPPGLDKHEADNQDGVDLTKLANDTTNSVSKSEQASENEKDPSENEKDPSENEKDPPEKDEKDVTETVNKDESKSETIELSVKVTNGSENNDKTKEDDLVEIKDPDNYLQSLEKILTKIHKSFYESYDRMESGKVPDLKSVIPTVRSKVLLGTKLVFSGLVQTHIRLENSKAYLVARSLGADVTQDLQPDTTHLVAVRSGTAKVNAGRRKKGLFIVTPDWLWTCAECWDKVNEQLYPLSNKPSKNRHPPPHCSSPEHVPNYEEGGKPGVRKRTPSGRFMDTINPLMSFSSDDIADMDREVEDILDNESESDGENDKKTKQHIEIDIITEESTQEKILRDLKKVSDTDKESSSTSDESLSEEHPKGWRKRSRDFDDDKDIITEGESTVDEFPSAKFRRGEELSSDLDMGQDSNSEGSVEAPDEIDDGDWNMMGAALEREFLSNN